jgi:putative spermidine/putrescine transport system permease protein
MTLSARNWRAAKTVASITVIFCFLFLFFFWPLLEIVVRSLNSEGKVDYSSKNFTWANYEGLLSDPALKSVALNTIAAAGLSTIVTLALAFPTAYLMSRLSKRTAYYLYAVMLFPFWISILIRLFAFTQLLSANGPINVFLTSLGFDQVSFLYGTAGIVIGMVNYLLPFLTLILYSSMSLVDPTLVIAAQISGASARQSFQRVFLPMIWPSVVGGTLLVFVMGFGFFLTPAILGGAKKATVATYIATQIQNYQWASASALGILLLLVSLLLFAVAVRVSGISQLIGVSSGGQKGTARGQPLVFGPLAVGLWFAALFSLAILIPPLLIVVPLSFEDTSYVVWPPMGHTWHWYLEFFTSDVWIDAAVKSLKAGLLASAISTTLGFVAARSMLLSRHKAVSVILGIMCFSPLSVPVILLAIGAFDTQPKLGLLGTTIGLASAHAVLALPFTVTTLLAALGRFDRRLEEAAWTLGASRLQTLRRVVAPVIMPSIVGAAILGFVTSWDEATIALFQTVGQDITLPVAFFSQMRSGADPSVAAVGTLVIVTVISLAALSLVVRRLSARRDTLSAEHS